MLKKVHYKAACMNQRKFLILFGTSIYYNIFKRYLGLSSVFFFRTQFGDFRLSFSVLSNIVEDSLKNKKNE